MMMDLTVANLLLPVLFLKRMHPTFADAQNNSSYDGLTQKVAAHCQGY